MKNFLVGAFAAYALTGCATGGLSPGNRLAANALNEVHVHAMNTEEFLSEGNSEREAVRQALHSLAAGLKDPDSAKFRNVAIKKYEGLRIVCGEVNAKNSYGAYVGFKKFAAGPTESTIEITNGRYAHIDAAANSGITAACEGPSTGPSKEELGHGKMRT